MIALIIIFGFLAAIPAVYGISKLIKRDKFIDETPRGDVADLLGKDSGWDDIQLYDFETELKQCNERKLSQKVETKTKNKVSTPKEKDKSETLELNM